MSKLQKIVLAAAAMLCTTVVAAAVALRPQQIPVDAETAWYHEDAAVKGAPQKEELTACYSTLEIPLSEGNCKVSLDAAPELNADQLDVWFTNSADNDVGLKLVIFDEEQNIIGESGIIDHGEYVRSVALHGDVKNGQRIEAKILTYEAETYYSLGSAKVTLSIR